MPSVNGNVRHACVDCGVFAAVTAVTEVAIGQRKIVEHRCVRCSLRRAVDQ
jgi:hypothetical protein